MIDICLALWYPVGMTRSLSHGLTVSGGNLVVVSGVDAVSQRVVEHLRFFLGEWYLDTAAGTPYRDGDDPILVHPQGVALAANRLASIAATVAEEVTGEPASVVPRNAKVNRLTRRMEVTLDGDTTLGSFTVELVP